MRAQGEGRILITGSIAGFMPGSYQAVYNGTKAFLDSFSYALREELKDTGVTVTCLMPGATETEFFRRADMLDTKVTVIDADSAFITGRGVIKNGKNVVPGQKKPIDISGEYRFLDVYAKRDGKWQVVASQTTKILTPGTTP